MSDSLGDGSDAENARELLREHEAALAKIDEAVARAVTRAGDALACHRGCASCCVGGLSVLPVEAAFIEASGARPPDRPREGMCVFLDDDGACSVYDARPVLCRTHGLALRGGEPEGTTARQGRGLPVLGADVSACSLNYTARPPALDEIIDATRLQMLLVTVDRRYRARVGLADDLTRIPLTEVAARLRGPRAG